MRLLLASKSAARKTMLAAAGVPFEEVSADFNEEAAKADLRGAGHGAAALAAELAARKALAAKAGPSDLVLGADQTLEREDGSMLDKPGSRADCLAQLRSLSGRTHRLHSAAAVARAGEVVWRETESVLLSVRPLSDPFLELYLEQEWEHIRWGVGGYRIEGPGVQLFDHIEGSHLAILGLPLLPLLGFLRREGVLAS